ncbi:MAG: PLDc N-terminal domain-containing protein [Mycobacterium leprae]
MDYSLGDVLVSMFWFMLLFAWIWLLITIVADLFRDPGVSGWGKAGWVLLLIVIPWLGALVYLIARGGSMNERTLRRAAAEEERLRQLAGGAAPTASTADELAKLANLQQRGILSEAEYGQAKALALAPPRAAQHASVVLPHPPV